MVKFGYMRYSKTVQILRLAVHCFPGATTCLFPASSGVLWGTGSTPAALPLPSLKHQTAVVATPSLITPVLMGFVLDAEAQAWGSPELQSTCAGRKATQLRGRLSTDVPSASSAPSGCTCLVQCSHDPGGL